MKKVFLIISLVIIGLIILPFINYALDEVEVGEEVKLYLGEVKIFSVSNPTRIVIGNPNIADVVSVSENTMTLVPKAVGTTTFVFWDNFGEQSYHIKVFAEDINEVKRRVDNMLVKLNLPEVYTQAEEEEGKVILLGRVKSPQDRERISLTLGPLKGKTVDLIVVKEEEAVVEIDVMVLELSKDATKILGFTWPASTTAIPLQTITEVTPRTTTATEFSKLFVLGDFTRKAFIWKIDALAEEGKARILSRPRLACQSGKEAELLVGGEKPIFATIVTEAGATGATVEYKEYGIKLKIKPTVTEEKKIKLALNVEVSELENVESLGTAASAYPLKKRNVSTEVFLDDGQTMAIGGLIKQKAEEDIIKTPWLGDIPVLGLLFRKKTTHTGGGSGERGDMELFITLTPTIVAGKEPAKEAAPSPAKEALPAETKPFATEDNIPAELKDYIKSVQLKIINAVYYPREAKDLGWEGTVNLVLRLASNGTLKEASISQSSGYKLLDDAALDVVQKQTPYPAFPNQVKLEELRIQLPIVYRKNNP